MERTDLAEIACLIVGEKAAADAFELPVPGTFIARGTFDVDVEPNSPARGDYFEKAPLVFYATLGHLTYKYPKIGMSKNVIASDERRRS